MFLSIIKKTEGPDSLVDDGRRKSGVDILAQNSDDGEALTGIKALKNKIKFVAKMAKMQKLLRDESESIMKIKAANDNKLPPGILLNGKEAITHFFDVKKNDAVNEMIPKYGYNKREYSNQTNTQNYFTDSQPQIYNSSPYQQTYTRDSYQKSYGGQYIYR